MEITFSCTRCGREFSKDASLAGKKARCKDCGHIFVIPGPPPVSVARVTRQPVQRPESRAPGHRTAPVARSVEEVEDPYGLYDIAPVSNPATSTPAGETENFPFLPRAKPSAESKKKRRSFAPPENPTAFEFVPGNVLLGLLAWFVAGGGVAVLVPKVGAAMLILGLFLVFLLQVYSLVGFIILPFRESTACGLMILFVPFYALYYLITRWSVMRGPLLTSWACTGFLLLSAIFLPALVAARNAVFGPISRPPSVTKQRETVAPAHPQPARQESLTLIVTGVASKEQGELFRQKLEVLLIRVPQPYQISESRSYDRTTYQISPIADVGSFVAGIDWATLKSGSDRIVELEVQPSVYEKNRPGDLDPIVQALYDLKSPLVRTRKEALVRLKISRPDPSRRVEVAKALESILYDPDMFTRYEAVEAMAVWGGKENTPVLVRALYDRDKSFRVLVLGALARLKDPEAAGPIAAMLVDERGKAGEALRAIGPEAESAVIPILSHPDFLVRLESAQILEVIGTEKSVPALQELIRRSNDTDKDAEAARKALQRIAFNAQSRHPDTTTNPARSLRR